MTDRDLHSETRAAVTSEEQDVLAPLLDSLRAPSFRARQIRRHVYQRLADTFAEMTDLPVALRELLDARLTIHTLEVRGIETSSDGLTNKLLFGRAAGAGTVEAVSIREEERHTICVSSQVGCAMGCVFCASGQLGLGRNLAAGEIVDQVLHVVRRFGRLTNIVFMGMGEPLANLDAVLKAIRRLHDQKTGLGISARRMTVSTVGIVPGIDRLASERPAVNLAVSLHASDDETRTRIVPPTQRYGVEEIVAAAVRYRNRTGRDVTYEYVLLEGINDGDDHARRLAKLIATAGRHGSPHATVNLIPYNPVPDLRYRTPSSRRVASFRRIVADAGIPVTVRKEKGRDVSAACGQLARTGINRPGQITDVRR